MTDIKILLASGGVVVIVLGLSVVWVIQQFFSGALRTLGQHSATYFVSGRRTIGRRDLRRYRVKTLQHDQRHPLGFLESEIDIGSIYVPLQYDAECREDIYHEIREKPRTVVLGAAGAGKSMLLRHSLVQWAQNPADFLVCPYWLSFIITTIRPRACTT